MTEDVRVVELPRDGTGRPGGARFGELVHEILAIVELEADAEGVRVTAEGRGRVLGASEEEVDAARAAVGDVLSHPLLRRAAAAAERGALRREAPVFLREEDGRILEGVPDLAFREEDPEEDPDEGPRWTVVDFKTDREVSGFRYVYERQVAAYVRAVSASTGEAARGVLLIV